LIGQPSLAFAVGIGFLVLAVVVTLIGEFRDD
jgi:hypothetical protein